MAVAYCWAVSSATARQGVITGSALRAPSCVPHCFATAEPSPMTHIVVPGVRSMLMTCRGRRPPSYNSLECTHGSPSWTNAVGPHQNGSTKMASAQ